MYGKLINGVLFYAPKSLKVEKRVHYNPSEELYKQFGYLPIEDTPYPENTGENLKYYTSEWVLENDKIVKVWHESEPPTIEEPTPTTEERLSALEDAVKELKNEG